MKTVIAFDTAGPVVGVAVATADGCVERSERSLRGAESRLVPWMQELLAELGISSQDLEGIAVSNGPGAFTGLRVGLASAIGIALSVDLPVYPCSSLRSRAAHIEGHQGAVLSMLDARKGRVYAALYSTEGALLAGPGDVEPEVAASWAPPGTLATGEGAVVYAALLEANGIQVASNAADVAVSTLARLAASDDDPSRWVSAFEVSAVYLRPPDAKKPRPEKLARLQR